MPRRKRHYFISDVYGKKYRKYKGGNGFSLDERLDKYNLIKSSLARIDKYSCLENKIFQSKDGPIDGYTINHDIDLKQSFGSKSLYGLIFQTHIKGLRDDIPVATKLMAINEYNARETELNLAISEHILETQKSRHFLFCYKAFICKNPLSINHPKMSDKLYFILLNEMAMGDLKTLDHSKLNMNILLQCLLSIATFHKMGYVHQD